MSTGSKTKKQTQPLPPPLENAQVPKIVGPVCLVSVLLEVNPRWDAINPSHVGAPCGIRHSLQVLRSTEHDNRRQVQFLIELVESEKAQSPNSYLGRFIEVVDVEFPDKAELTPAVQDQAAAWFTANILIGSARAHLDLMTALGPHPRVTLAPVNQRELIGRARVSLTDGDQTVPMFDEERASKATLNK